MTNYTADSDLVLWYPMTDGSGSTVNDYSGNSNDGTINGAEWVKTPYQGSYGLDFDGTDDKITTSSGTDFSTVTSIGFWLNANASQVQEYPVVLAADTNKTIRFYPTIDGLSQVSWRLATGTGSSWDTDLNGSTDIADGTSHHVFIVIDSSNNNRKVYIDGSLEVTNTDSCSLTDSSVNIRFGGRYDSHSAYFYTGKISNVMIFDRELSEEEIKDIYNKTYRS